MNHKEYNGWYNYETWVVKLWMDNEEPSYRYWQERTESIIEDTDKSETDWKNHAIRGLMDELKEGHESALPELTGLVSDLLNAAMSEVNWYEIAESMITDYLADHPEVAESEKEETE